MNGVNILIVGLGAFGFLPMGVFLYKKRLADRILATGRPVQAWVYHKVINRKSNYEVVHYHFIAADGKQYTGKLTTRPGIHRMNDAIEIFYLPDNPKHNTVRGAWKSYGFLIFVIIIAVWVLFMSYKLYEMVNNGGI
ncbi:MAG: hypothetical protein EOO04_12290 [Chitinophagaceae bacterium]|nr:MAG: hypothetical protein EOO04_12290 [Chitinophagaceae bacterium]